MDILENVTWCIADYRKHSPHDKTCRFSWHSKRFYLSVPVIQRLGLEAGNLTAYFVIGVDKQNTRLILMPEEENSAGAVRFTSRKATAGLTGFNKMVSDALIKLGLVYGKYNLIFCEENGYFWCDYTKQFLES